MRGQQPGLFNKYDHPKSFRDFVPLKDKVEKGGINRSVSEGKLRGLRNMPQGNQVFLVDGPAEFPSKYEITTHQVGKETPKVIHVCLDKTKGRFEHSPEVHRRNHMAAQKEFRV